MEENKIQQSPQELIKRFSTIQGITEDEAKTLVGAETSEEILANILKYTKEKIRVNSQPKNRAQRRALAKKLGKKNRSNAELISDTAEKLNYIDLIQKLRKLNEEKEKENNGSCENEEN